jgi:CheY-like chemotaxis protein
MLTNGPRDGALLDLRPRREDARRVLVVDDNADAADTMGEVLTESGYAVQVAYEGEAALRAFHEAAPDVVLLDLGLPDLDGLEVARRLRSTPEGRAAWLVAVTGYGRDQERRNTEEAGFDHHLVKPVNVERLLAWIERAERRTGA